MSASSPPMAELLEIYGKLSEELAAFRCAACGRCCHFDEVDHILYASSLEVKAALEISGQRPAAAKPGRCPYQVREKCEARQGRPLGCRLHFCNLTPEEALKLEEISTRYHNLLRHLHDRLGEPWSYQPFINALRPGQHP